MSCHTRCLCTRSCPVEAPRVGTGPPCRWCPSACQPFVAECASLRRSWGSQREHVRCKIEGGEAKLTTVPVSCKMRSIAMWLRWRRSRRRKRRGRQMRERKLMRHLWPDGSAVAQISLRSRQSWVARGSDESEDARALTVITAHNDRLRRKINRLLRGTAQVKRGSSHVVHPRSHHNEQSLLLRQRERGGLATDTEEHT